MGASRRYTKGGGRLRRPSPFVDSSGGGISALRLVRSARPCAMLAKSVFVLKTKVSCPAAASGGFVRPKIWSRSEFCKKNVKKLVLFFVCYVTNNKKMKVLRMGLPMVENDRTDVLHLSGSVKFTRNQAIQILMKMYAWHLAEVWLSLEGQRKQQNESSQNGLAYSGKS